ncbi:carbohydrate ABC transporter permease [Micromonospora coxensis]|uniref:Carbohydrate ABC transporter membrane protein 2, CUT1 family n=1 Tax=Micromonospora coxensis TaxID=356852 RepID=A0A1C5GVV1_9ACTN|nr:carbohydrate ABC transporter permease [Micromonospora coxensis]SCG37833.1 carbohydrate ABC transporter membrane protein 2, CUT1 family [Micromonospora coxensis]
MLTRHRLFRTAAGIFLMSFAVIQLVPFYVALTTALKPKSDLSSQWMPPTGQIYLDNFRTALEQGGILRAIGNSIAVTSVSTVLVCLLGALAAYPLARRGTWVNRAVMVLMIGSIMVPPLSVLVPLYSMMNQLGGVNTYWGIILILVTGQLPLSVFLYTAFIRTVPTALEEAARVDGADTFRVFFRIVLPLLKPVTATVAILTGVFIWNDYQMSVYMLTTDEVRTIAPAIGAFFSQQSSNLGAAAAAALMAMAPILLAYLVLQRHFIKGMIAGAEK